MEIAMYIEHGIHDVNPFALFIMIYLILNKVVASMYIPPNVLYVDLPYECS